MIDLTVAPKTMDQLRKEELANLKKLPKSEALAELPAEAAVLADKARRAGGPVEFLNVWDEALIAVREAHRRALPEPMDVVDAGGGRRWHVPEGA